jgi:AcrR family transcriptional regulator
MSAERKPRADALRNRERLLEVAKKAFTAHGTDVSLEDVAREAGVGPGTLYRHFPNRDALLENVYRAEVAKLAEEQKRLSATLAPVDALKAWMVVFVDYIATKKVIAAALNAMVGGSSELFASTGEQVKTAVRYLVARAVEAGEIRPDVEPLDLLRALVGVANVASSPDWQQSAIRLIDILILGSRPIKQ